MRCPAKVNTFLSVGRRDRRGYHPLRSIFQAIDLCDTLEIEFGTEATQVTSDWPEMPPANTVSRTLRLISDVAPLPSMRVHIVKRIPAQSGLGGGSSDSAGLLRALRVRYPKVVSESACLEIAKAVGSDVPFFLVGGRALAEGYGEKLTGLPDEPTKWLVVHKPAIDCGTADAYANLDKLELELRDPGSKLENDFLRVAPRVCLDAIESLRSAGAVDAGLTGSGSAVFGICDSYEAASICRDGITEALGAQSWIAKTLSRAQSLQIEPE